MLEDVIGTIAIAFGAINIVGGFMVTDRMLGMFARKPKPAASDADGGRRRGAVNVLAVLEPGGDARDAALHRLLLLFIFGVRRGTHPTTAKQGNLIAAVGMAIAVVDDAAARRDRQLGRSSSSGSRSAPPSGSSPRSGCR